MGSISVAAWVAGLAFPALLFWGFLSEELGPKTIAWFLIVAVGMWIGLPRLSFAAGYLVTPVLATLDVVLVLLVFKRDIRIF